MNEEELRDLLHGAAGRGGVALLDDDAAVDAVVERHGAQRRRRVAGLAVAACLALVAVVLPAVWPSVRPAPDIDVARAQAAVLDWPTRGSLAGDADAVDTVRGLTWGSPEWAPAVEERRVAFLGDVPGSRRALVVGRTDVSGAVTGQWFSGPVGADPASLVPEGPVERLEDVASVAHAAAPGDVAVVLVAPGDAVELSPRVEVGADGSVRRDFAPVEAEDGVVVTSVDAPTVHGSPAAYRVLRNGTVTEQRPVPVSFAREFVWDPPVLTPLDPDSEPPVAEAVDIALEGVLAQTGLTKDEVRLDLLYSGPLAGRGEDGVVLAVTLPNGAVVVSVAWADMSPTGGGSAGGCGMQAHPAGTPLTSLVVGVRCLLSASGDLEPLLLVYLPPGVESVDAVDENGVVTIGNADGGAGFASFEPAPERGVLRYTADGAGPREQAVVGGRQDEIVDLAGDGALD